MNRLGGSRAVAVGLVLACAAILTTFSTLWAHGALRSSSPAAGAHLDRVPLEIRLTFNEAAERAFTRIVLLDASGRAVSLGPVTIPADSPSVAIARILETLSPGVHTVQWQMAGRDAHPVRGNFIFTVAPGALADTPRAEVVAPHHSPTAIPDNPDPSSFDAESPLYVTIRWLTFMAAFLLIGVVSFRYAVIGRLSVAGRQAGLALIEPALERAAGVGAGAALVLMVVGGARLYAQSVAMHGPAALESMAIGSMVVGTLWGQAWLLQIAAAIVAGTSFVFARKGSLSWWAVAAIAGVGIALSMSLSGHAPATPRWSFVAVPLDTLHVLSAASWLGTLVLVIVAGIGVAGRLSVEQRDMAVADVINAFSPAALTFAALAALTGLASAAIQLGAVRALWTSDYGRLLVIKLVVLSALTATGAYNWLRVRPRLGDQVGTQRIRRTATAEALIGAAVLAVTAVLVATATP